MVVWGITYSVVTAEAMASSKGMAKEVDEGCSDIEFAWAEAVAVNSGVIAAVVALINRESKSLDVVTGCAKGTCWEKKSVCCGSGAMTVPSTMFGAAVAGTVMPEAATLETTACCCWVCWPEPATDATIDVNGVVVPGIMLSVLR